jgi:hypothetical protein
VCKAQQNTNLANGRDHFVVINDRIMKQLEDGKLARYSRDSAFAGVSSAVSKPYLSLSKMAQVGARELHHLLRRHSSTVACGQQHCHAQEDGGL